jgi:hypothetical protein
MDRAPNLGLPFFYRVVIPGSAVTAWLLPLLFQVLDAMPRLAGYEGQILLALVIVLGFVASILGDTIYEVYEGRRGWPRAVARWCTDYWQEQVDRLLRHAQDPTDPLFDERWSELRQFPVAAGPDGITRPVATAPTKLGNILASYEQYPERRYGMEPSFYWERLWLSLDKDVRQEIDAAWAATDTLLYTSAASFFVGVIYLATAILMPLSTALMVVDSGELPFRYAALGLAALLIGLLLYLWSLPGHLANGEMFKSVFDLYRSRIENLSVPTAQEKSRWRQTFERLQYEDYQSSKSAKRAREPWISTAVKMILRALSARHRR